jgi:hypothetical protein
MSDEFTDAERAQCEALSQAISEEFERRLWEVPNDPTTMWARVPREVAEGSARFFEKVLRALAQADPNDLAFGLRLIHQVEQQLVARTTGTAPPMPTAH